MPILSETYKYTFYAFWILIAPLLIYILKAFSLSASENKFRLLSIKKALQTIAYSFRFMSIAALIYYVIYSSIENTPNGIISFLTENNLLREDIVDQSADSIQAKFLQFSLISVFIYIIFVLLTYKRIMYLILNGDSTNHH